MLVDCLRGLPQGVGFHGLEEIKKERMGRLGDGLQRQLAKAHQEIYLKLRSMTRTEGLVGAASEIGTGSRGPR